ncbi:MAG: CPBP family intramembrane metalloprotease [Pseudomonadota bacterium]|nr:CPBP family intramembrane metalloprotease [Pseudomonadota bacterium]
MLPTPAADPTGTPTPPRVWTVFLALFLGVVANLLGAVLVGFLIVTVWTVVRFAEHGAAPSTVIAEQVGALIEHPGFKGALYAGGSVATLLVALSAAYKSPTPLRVRLALGPDRWGGRALAYLAVSVGALACGQAAAMLATLAGAGSDTLENFDALIRAAPAGWLVVLAIPVVVLAPLGEELFFRGYVQTRLCARWGAPAGVAAASVVFGLFHVDPVHVFVTTILGLFLGWASARGGSIRATIVAHAVNNLVALVGSRLGLEAPAGAVAWGVLVGSIGLTAACVAWLQRVERAQA